MIFWYSDHGGPLPRQKRLLYDAGLQVPMIIRYPDKWRAGELDDQLISFVDFKSTALSLAGIEPPEYVDGQAFAGEFQSSESRRFIQAAADPVGRQYATIREVREVTLKYFRKDKHNLELIPANKDFSTIRIDLREQDAFVEGKSVGLIRTH